MAYAKLQEWKKRLKKKITAIALFSMIVTSTMTNQAVTALAATQSLPDQTAIETVEATDDSEDIVSGPQYTAGQDITINGRTYKVFDVYSTNNDPETCSFDEFLIKDCKAGGIPYSQGTKVHRLYSFDSSYKSKPGSIRVLLQNEDGSVVETNFDIRYVMSQQEYDDKLAEEKKQADDAAIAAVAAKIDKIKLYSDGVSASEVISSSNEDAYRGAFNAYNDLDENLQSQVDTTKLDNFIEDQKTAYTVNTNSWIDSIPAPTSIYGDPAGEARRLYNVAVAKYPDIQPNLHLAHLEECEANYKQYVADYKAKQNPAASTTQTKPMTSFGDTTAKQEEAVQKAPGSVDNLSGYEVSSEKTKVDSYGYYALQGITANELLAAHPLPNNPFEPNGFWQYQDGDSTTGVSYYHFEGTTGFIVDGDKVYSDGGGWTKDLIDKCCNIKNINLYAHYTIPAKSNPGSGSTVFVLRANQKFKYTGKLQGNYIQIKSKNKVGWIKNNNWLKKRIRVQYVTKKHTNNKAYHTAYGSRTYRKGEKLVNGSTRWGFSASALYTTYEQPSTAWILKSGTLTKSSGSGATVCKVKKGSKIRIKEENASYFKVTATKGNKSYTGWLKKSAISFSKTYPNKKAVKTMYLAKNVDVKGAYYAKGDKVKVLKFAYRKFIGMDGSVRDYTENCVYTTSYKKLLKMLAKGTATQPRVIVQFEDGLVSDLGKEELGLEDLRTTKKAAMNSVSFSKEQSKAGWDYINAVRKKHGLKPLAWDDEQYEKAKKCLESAGSTVSFNMAVHGYVDTEGTNFSEQFYDGTKGSNRYSELASGNTIMGMGGKTVQNNYKSSLDTWRSSNADGFDKEGLGVGICAATEMLGGKAGFYNCASDRGIEDHHAEKLMTPERSCGCMILVQGYDGKIGAYFYVNTLWKTDGGPGYVSY